MRPVLPAERICSAERKRYSSLQTTMAPSATGTLLVKPLRRVAVACNIVSPPVRDNSCFGYFSRDIGHRRVPEPPDRITG